MYCNTQKGLAEHEMYWDVKVTFWTYEIEDGEGIPWCVVLITFTYTNFCTLCGMVNHHQRKYNATIRSNSCENVMNRMHQ